MNNYIQHCNNYRIRKLSLNETIKSFDCGDPDLNDFIINDANNYRNSLLVFDIKNSKTQKFKNSKVLRF